jgi:hypothetical protein
MLDAEQGDKMSIAQRTKGYALAVGGGLWFGIDVFIIRGNVNIAEDTVRRDRQFF